ncbi:MAG: hypothetical protein ACLQNE_27705 [Thermoguttaceae bacterium]
MALRGVKVANVDLQIIQWTDGMEYEGYRLVLAAGGKQAEFL